MDAGELVVGQALEDELESQVEHTYSMMACHGVYKYYLIEAQPLPGDCQIFWRPWAQLASGGCYNQVTLKAMILNDILILFKIYLQFPLTLEKMLIS